MQFVCTVYTRYTASAAGASSCTASSCPVLVADNDMNIRYFLKRRLSYLGYTVIIAANGQEVLSLFAKKTTGSCYS
jgi:DNA-binding NtrC family response regulator